jgi:hypothetical protein
VAGELLNIQHRLDAEKGLGMPANRPKQSEEFDAWNEESHAQS